MKKLICLFLAIAMVLFSASAFAEAAEAPAETLFVPGTYTAEAQGIFVPWQPESWRQASWRRRHRMWTR